MSAALVATAPSFRWPRALIPAEVEQLDAALADLSCLLLDRATRDGVGARGFIKHLEMPVLSAPEAPEFLYISLSCQAWNKRAEIDEAIHVLLEPDVRYELNEAFTQLRGKALSGASDGLRMEGWCSSHVLLTRAGTIAASVQLQPIPGDAPGAPQP